MERTLFVGIGLYKLDASTLNIEYEYFKKPAPYIASIDISKDGNMIAAAGSWDYKIFFIKYWTNNEEYTVFEQKFPNDNNYDINEYRNARINAIQIFSEDKFIFSGSMSGQVAKWNSEKMKLVQSFGGNLFCPYMISMSQKQDKIVVNSDNSSGVCVINLTEPVIKTYKNPQNFEQGKSVIFNSNDDKLLVESGSYLKFDIFELERNKPIFSFIADSTNVIYDRRIFCFKHDLSKLLTTVARGNKDYVLIYDTELNKAIGKYTGEINSINSIDINEDNSKALICGLKIINRSYYANSLYFEIFDIDKNKQVLIFENDNERNKNINNPCAYYINNLIICYDKSDDTKHIRFILNSSTGKELYRFSGNELNCDEILKGKISRNVFDDKMLLECNDGLCLIDLNSGERINVPIISDSLFFGEVTFNNSKNIIAYSCFSKKDNYSCVKEGYIYLYDVVTKKIIKVLKGHKNRTFSLAFNKKGTLLISTSSDNQIKVWDIASGKELISLFIMHNGTDFVAYTPDGRFDGTEEGIKTSIHFVSGMNVIPLENLYEQFYTPNLLQRVLGGEVNDKPDINIANLKLPPLVKITNPENNKNSTTETITVTVDATDKGGGIDEILLYHNDKLVETTNRGFKPVEQIGSKSSKTFTITLSNGENIIKATAFNTQRTEAIPYEITVNYTGTQTAKSNLYMLVIGINEYKNSKYNLNYAVADASSFKDAMQTGSSSIFGKVNTIFIKDDEATKIRIIEELNKIKEQAKQQDMFVFYYAGHGAMSEEQKSLFYLIPTDVTQMFSAPVLQEKAVSASELKQFSTEIKAQKQMFILDACQSGGMEEVLAARGAAEEKAIAQLARSTGTYWLAAANSDQFAGEFAQLSHGLFTYCILQALTGKADARNDKKVTVQELSAYLNDQVPILSKQYKGSEQYPVTYGFGQDFPIVIIK